MFDFLVSFQCTFGYWLCWVICLSIPSFVLAFLSIYVNSYYENADVNYKFNLFLIWLAVYFTLGFLFLAIPTVKQHLEKVVCVEYKEKVKEYKVYLFSGKAITVKKIKWIYEDDCNGFYHSEQWLEYKATKNCVRLCGYESSIKDFKQRFKLK